MIAIDRDLINRLIDKAKSSPRLRANHNFHADFADPVNRMLNAIEPGTYIQPHKHENPDKREVFLILTGKAAIITFNDEGVPQTCRILTAGGACMGAEIPPRVFHTLLALESGTVCYEIKDGPYEPATDKQFAPWAPAEGNPECQNYLNRLTAWTQNFR